MDVLKKRYLKHCKEQASGDSEHEVNPHNSPLLISSHADYNDKVSQTAWSIPANQICSYCPWPSGDKSPQLSPRIMASFSISSSDCNETKVMDEIIPIWTNKKTANTAGSYGERLPFNKRDLEDSCETLVYENQIKHRISTHVGNKIPQKTHSTPVENSTASYSNFGSFNSSTGLASTSKSIVDMNKVTISESFVAGGACKLPTNEHWLQQSQDDLDTVQCMSSNETLIDQAALHYHMHQRAQLASQRTNNFFANSPPSPVFHLHSPKIREAMQQPFEQQHTDFATSSVTVSSSPNAAVTSYVISPLVTRSSPVYQYGSIGAMSRNSQDQEASCVPSMSVSSGNLNAGTSTGQISLSKCPEETSLHCDSNMSNLCKNDDMPKRGKKLKMGPGVKIPPHKTIKSSKNAICDVCGENSAGFHFGAYACEACKKFFTRSVKQIPLKYTCNKSESCIITKESRVSCQFCRYQKCLAVGLCKPDEYAQKQTKITAIPCKVCGAPSSGYHFGAITCEGCKGFFRRTMKEDPSKIVCAQDGHCTIKLLTRNLCKPCRYKKCVKVGMTQEGSRIGRQPSSIKHATMLEARSLSLDQGTKTEPVSPPTEASSEVTCESDALSIEQADSSEFISIPTLSQTDYTEIKDGVLVAFNDLNKMKEESVSKKILVSNDDSSDKVWQSMMANFTYDSKCVISFAKKVPGFGDIVMDDKEVLVQMCIYQLVLCVHSQYYNLITKEYAYFGYTNAEERIIIRNFPEFEILPSHFVQLGEIVQSLQILHTELALICVLQLTLSEGLTLKDKEHVDELHRKFKAVLLTYVQENGDKSRYHTILSVLPTLQKMMLEHLGCVIALQKRRSVTPEPLFKELFYQD